MNAKRRAAGAWPAGRSTVGAWAAGVFALSSGAAVVAGMLACGTSSYVNTGGATADGGQLALATEGQPCSDSTVCASHLCLLVATGPDQPADAQADAGGPVGLCSAGCTTSAECGDAGLCVPEPVIEGGPLNQGGACYRSCAVGSDCAAGIPCIWQSSFDAGICEPLPKSFCQDIASMRACQQCLGMKCCAAVTACAEDVACAASLGNLSADASASGGNAAAQALAACALEGGPSTGSCAAECR